MKISRIVLIEDDKKKIEDIRQFLQTSVSHQELTVKESYQSGLRELLNSHYDLLLLDMSIPTWDKSPTERGGSFEKFGGYKVLREAVRKGRPVKTILITMFDDFGESDRSITIDELDKALKSEFPEIYLGSVYYNSQENKWKDDLMEMIANK